LVSIDKFFFVYPSPLFLPPSQRERGRKKEILPIRHKPEGEKLLYFLLLLWGERYRLISSPSDTSRRGRCRRGRI